MAAETLIIVDDRIVYGDDMRFAITNLKRKNPSQGLILATPLCGAETMVRAHHATAAAAFPSGDGLL